MLTRQQHRPRPSVLSTIALLTSGLFKPSSVVAVPHPRDNLHDAGYGYLMLRDCAAYCGYMNQYCCASNEVCYTTLNPQGQAIAGCSTAHGGAGYAWYTTTWTETETFTSTISSHFPGQTTPVVGGGVGGGGAGGGGGQCVPQAGTGQIACGPICCANDQYCAYNGQCLPNVPGGGVGGGGGIVPITTTVTSNGQVYTTQYSAPYRVTSGVTVTQTAGASGIFASASASPTGNGTVTTGTASKLSGGAIAGIVIGSIAGVALLLLICACCLVRGLWHGLMALLGMGGKKDKDRRDSRRTETIIEEERYSRHGSVHGRRENHGGWFGGRGGGGGGRPSTVASRKEKKSGGAGGLLGLAGVLGTAALLLGLKKDHNKKKRNVKTRSDVSSSYMSYDSYSDPSTFA